MNKPHCIGHCDITGSMDITTAIHKQDPSVCMWCECWESTLYLAVRHAGALAWIISCDLTPRTHHVRLDWLDVKLAEVPGGTESIALPFLCILPAHHCFAAPQMLVQCKATVRMPCVQQNPCLSIHNTRSALAFTKNVLQRGSSHIETVSHKNGESQERWACTVCSKPCWAASRNLVLEIPANSCTFGNCVVNPQTSQQKIL